MRAVHDPRKLLSVDTIRSLMCWGGLAGVGPLKPPVSNPHLLCWVSMRCRCAFFFRQPCLEARKVETLLRTRHFVPCTMWPLLFGMQRACLAVTTYP